METDNELIAQINGLFHPRSVAVIGVPRGMKTGKVFLTALLDQGFSGRIFPVNPRAREINGLKAYPSISAIPGPVDLAIVLVPHHSALGVVKECAAKGVKGAVLFTAGFAEKGTDEGKVLEAELVRVARSAKMRLIGPNGMGLYSPKSGLSFFPRLSKDPGPVGIISHSGSLTNILGRMAPHKGIRFSKVVSSGNECDLNCADFLTYLGWDPDTHIIAAYLEGIKNGSYFLNALRQASLKKPVIIWKVGLTKEGARASESHTGALTGSQAIWQAVIRQSGAISVVGFEAWVDAMMGFSLLMFDIGPRIAVISGPGGLAVSAAEACGSEGLRLANLSSATRSELARFVPATGTSLRNPIDVSLTASFDTGIYIKAARAVAADPEVDAVVVVGIGLTPEANQQYFEGLSQAHNEFQKPFLMVNIPGFDPELARKFCANGIAFFESTERAMHTYALVRQYQSWRKKQF